MKTRVNVIGLGLAGCEAVYQLAKRGILVDAYEMKPTKFSAAHNLQGFAEIVCSNSFKSDDLGTASGCLKAEMRELDSLILKCAEKAKQAFDADEEPCFVADGKFAVITRIMTAKEAAEALAATGLKATLCLPILD